MLRVLALDNEEIYLRGLVSVLSCRSGVKLEWMLVDADLANSEPSGGFDLLIVGISHRGWHQLTPALPSIRSRCERSVALISDCSRPHMKEILESDFNSLVHRSASVVILNRAIDSTARGSRYVDETVGVWLLSEAASRWSVFSLTAREREIADLLITDLTIADLARHLRISHNTIKYHVSNVYRKVGVKGRRGLRDIGGGPG